MDEHGYCLLYPSGYSIERPTPEEMVLVVGSLLDVSNPRVYVKVSDAGGQTTEQAASAIVADFPGFDIGQGEATIGGSNAVVLDGVPGQDVSRQVVVVRGNRLYQIDVCTRQRGCRRGLYANGANLPDGARFAQFLR